MRGGERPCYVTAMVVPRARSVRRVASGVLALLVIAGALVQPAAAQVGPTCGVSNGHTVCVTLQGTTLTGAQLVSITNTPNTDLLFATWSPTGPSASVNLIEKFAPSPETGDYSFTWPTQKYMDATGSLSIRSGSKTATPVVVAGITLSNGNASDIQRTPNDWQGYLPGAWTQPYDAVVPAVGDGPSDEVESNAVAAMIDAADPPLFAFLGDIYEKGTFTENLNHYGVSALDVPGGGTLWGATADVTQPALGNHEDSNLEAWTDYWHQRPTYTAYTFGGALFLDLNSSDSFAVGSPQYTFVQNALASAPACVVAYFHIPVFKNSNDDPALLPMWSLLADNGGDLVLSGHTHTMSEYVPLDANGLAGGRMVQILAGSGGHSPGGSQRGPRIAWSQGGTPGALFLTLDGSASGGTADGLSWAFKDTSGNVLRTGGVGCGAGSAGPSVFGFDPTSGTPGTPVDISGSGFTGASDVTFGGVGAGAGSFTVSSDSSITATVPAGATTGPVCVTVSGSTGCSSASFTVVSPGVIQRVGQIGAVSNTSGVVQNNLSVTVTNPVVQGDTVVIGVGAQNKVSVVSAADSRGNTYQVDAVRQYAGATGGKSTTALVAGVATTALQPGDTITVTLSKGNAWGFVAEDWAGISGLDRTGTNDSAGVKTTAVSVSTSGATSASPEAVFVVTTTSGWPGLTAGSGYIETADLQLRNGTAKRELGLGYAIVSTTGVQTGTYTLGRAGYWVAAIATYA